MPDRKQLERLRNIVKGLEQGMTSSVKALQKNLGALTGIAGGVPPKPKKELIRALESLRKALNRAILALEKRLGKGGGSRRPRSRKRKTTAA